MKTVRVTKGKHTWFTENPDGTTTMETDWDALAREIELATSEYQKPSRQTRKRGKTIKKDQNHGRQSRQRS